MANLSNWLLNKYNVTYIIKMDWNKRITSKDAAKMMDAYAKVYAPKEEPKTDEASDATETTASAEAENTEEKTT